MALLQLGYVIKKRRLALGVTQEQLCDGLCAVATLSRIENGERQPKKALFDALMQRLGYSGEFVNVFTDERDFRLHELRFDIRQHIITNDLDTAQALLEELSLCPEADDIQNRQFIKIYLAAINKSNHANEELIKEFEQAVKLTLPNFGRQRVSDMLLCYDEIIALNNLANCHGASGDRDSAIRILYELREYFNKHVISPEEKLRTYTMILYNLSKWLGLDERYNECISICDEGIFVCGDTGRAKHLSYLLYNKAWAMSKRKHEEDMESAAGIVKLAYYVALAMGNKDSAARYRRFSENTLGIALE